MTKDIFWFTLSNIFFQGSKFLTYLYVAKLLGPKTYGLWNGLILILSYGMNSHLGVLNAMNRDVPYYLGAENSEKIEEIQNISLGAICVSSLILAVIVFLSSYLTDSDTETITGLRFIALILISQQVYLFYQMLLKSHYLFGFMSIQQTLFSVLTILVVLPLTYYFRFDGFLAGQLIVNLAILMFILRKIPITATPAFEWKTAWTLSKTGFPIMLAGVAYGIMTTVDRMAILKYLGKEQMGYYSLSVMAAGMLLLLPMTVSQIIYPRMSRKFGETRQIESLKPLIYRPAIHLMWIMAIILIGVYFILPPLIRYFLPEYVKGIASLKIMIVGVYFLSLVGGFANFLNTVGLQNIYLSIQFIAIIIAALLCGLSLKLNLGIEGIAWATSLTYIIYAFLLISTTLYFQKRKP
ncbi:MAG: hypothetical protein BWK80_21570 [Desulfobacteraceae bacterium IS3]|nr:MAG: hypothetical protein BWK80_21570 [Desulfobacteraceae bacterium IS3]